MAAQANKNPAGSLPRDFFNPVIADQHAIYLTGYANLFQLLPRAAARPQVPSDGSTQTTSKPKPAASARHCRRRCREFASVRS